MRLDRTGITVVLAAILVIGGGLLRPPAQVQGVPPEQFWNQKLLWGPHHDLVLAGDSRTFQGLSPAKMAETLRGRRIVNFAFATAGMTPYYLRAAAALLDPASPRRALLLGVTPHSLTPNAARENELISRWTQIRPWHPGLIARQFDNEFLSLKSQERMGVELSVRLGGLFHFFRPYAWHDFNHWWSGAGTGYFQTYHSDGWVACRQIPEDHATMLKWAERIFLGNRVSPEIMERFVEAVRELRAQNVRVYAFFVPTPPRMEKIEVEQSGFQEAALAGLFRAAGGTWLTLPRRDFPSHDGSHLREDGALELSRTVAELIAAWENQ